MFAGDLLLLAVRDGVEPIAGALPELPARIDVTRNRLSSLHHGTPDAC
jgi:hypothetical protein